MLKVFVEEAAALASIVLFVGMIAVWAQLIPQLWSSVVRAVRPARLGSPVSPAGPPIEGRTKNRQLPRWIAMGELLVWCVRLGLVVVLIGTASLVAALSLLVGDIGGDLRRVLGAVAICAFSSLALLVSTMLAFRVGHQFSLRLRNRMNRRGLG
jgi:hypothetical protein